MKLKVVFQDASNRMISVLVFPLFLLVFDSPRGFLRRLVSSAQTEDTTLLAMRHRKVRHLTSELDDERFRHRQPCFDSGFVAAIPSGSYSQSGPKFFNCIHN